MSIGRRTKRGENESLREAGREKKLYLADVQCAVNKGEENEGNVEIQYV